MRQKDQYLNFLGMDKVFCAAGWVSRRASRHGSWCAAGTSFSFEGIYKQI
jgi:hypothetical protein